MIFIAKIQSQVDSFLNGDCLLHMLPMFSKSLVVSIEVLKLGITDSILDEPGVILLKCAD